MIPQAHLSCDTTLLAKSQLSGIIPVVRPIKLPKLLPPIIIIPILVLLLSLSGWFNFQLSNKNSFLSKVIKDTEVKLQRAQTEVTGLKNQDQYQKNETLQKDITNIQTTYKNSITSYEKITDLKDQGVKTASLNQEYASIVKLLADKNYASASASLDKLNKSIEEQTVKTSQPPQNQTQTPVTQSNQPPSSGYQRQAVQTGVGTFTVDIISADLGSTRVIVDTASDSDCGNNCPTMAVADYAKRSGAFAAINGSFFCPAEYPSCAGKTNSFDTLLMNKNKVYFNSANNVYSTVPAVIFSGNSARFVSRSLEWGRDTGVDAVLANYPILLLGGQSSFSGSSDNKINSKGARNFIGTNGSKVYIGVVRGASTTDEVEVLKTLGIQDALGLDQGGSTALWYGGYKVGPGRNVPNAILFVRK